MSNPKTHMSDDIRKLIVKYVLQQGKSKKQTGILLDVPESTVRYTIKCFEERGNTEAIKRGGNQPKKLTPEIQERLINLMEDDNIYTLADIKHHLNIIVHPPTVWKWLKSLNYSWKITRPIPERRNDASVKAERVDYIRWYQAYSVSIRYSNIIYLDESPFNLNIIKSHAWSRVGTTPNPVVNNSRGSNVTMILAVNSLNIVSSEAIIHTGVNGQIFKGFLNNLVRILGRCVQYTLVMDNVRFHHVDEDFKDNYPYELVYLPRYSPFLNPCEEVFSKLKNTVARGGRLLGTDDLVARMQTACSHITSDDLSGYIGHAETFFNDCLESRDIGRD